MMDTNKELHNALNNSMNLLAEGLSKFIRRFENTEQRVYALKHLSKPPEAKLIKIVNEQAISNEDFETCEALKIYAEERGIEL